MTTERWQRLEQVFAEVREYPSEARPDLVARACGADEALRADALSLLAAADQSGDFLNTPAFDTLANEIAADGWSLRPGDRVGVYTVDRLLGAGGSGEVWRAHDDRIGRDVAIKILLPHFSSDAERLRRFAEEARTAGALNHPNILAVYDVGEHRGTPFLVTECLEGESLRARLEREPLPVDEALAVGLHIARGLAAAHARGIIHRDLKPDNVFLRSDGGVRILDFGLAKLQLSTQEPQQAARPHTMIGVIAGTAGYMAPEQVRGEDVDARADIFALGATMYEMLGSRRPFSRASTVETLHAILTADPADLSTLNPQVPSTLSRLVHRCLEKSPDGRFQTASDLAAALEAAIAARRAPSAIEVLSLLRRSAAGTRLGDYVVGAYIGRGASGEVYRARDTRLNRDVALNVLPEACAANPDCLARVQRGAQVLASVNHPNIAAIHALEESDGVCLLVLELVEGPTLADRIARSPLPLEEALSVARQVAGALEAAHEHGILHRDLKPSNIKLGTDGAVKVLGFGLVNPAPPDQDASPYLSPEQARGEVIDRRADIWAFGSVLFEMLTGKVVGREPDWPALPAHTPRAVRALLHRCLQNDAARRLRDAGDARLELEDLDADRVGQPGHRSAIVPWAFAGAAILAAAVALSGLVAWQSRGPATRPTMRFSAVTSFSGIEAQPSFSPDGRSVAFVSNRDGQWDVYVGLVTGGTLIRITNDPNVETHPRWAPDGTRLLFGRLNDTGRYDIWIAPSLGGSARRLVLNGQSPTWSRDGRAIAYSSSGVIWISDANGANPRPVTRAEPPLVHYQPAFSRDGRSLAFIRKYLGPFGELALVDVHTGDVRRLTNDGGLALSPVWSPDDKSIFFTSSRGGTLNVWRMAVAPGEPQQITAGSGDDTDIDLSADGTRLVFSSYKANLNLAELTLDAASIGGRKWLTSDSVRGEVFPRYSPDGRRIAYFSNRVGGEEESTWVMDADGTNASRIAGGVHPRWTADGQEVVIGTGWGTGSVSRRGMSRVALAGGAPQSFPINPWSLPWGDIARDGRVLYRTSGRTVEILDPRANRKDTIADVPGVPFWSRDGRTFAFIVLPGAGEPSETGLWTQTPGSARHQVFPGWVVWAAWGSSGELWVLEGKADLKGVLWRLDADGARNVVRPNVALFILHSSPHVGPQARFDVHPDGRRLVIDALEFAESDIGLIDNVP